MKKFGDRRSIFFIIVALILFAIQVFLWWKIIRSYIKSGNALRYALINNRACPAETTLNCAYVNKDLPEPDINQILPLSIYLANIVGKLEMKFQAPLSVLLEIYYNSNLFGWILEGNSAVYIVYRGTATLDEWAQDFSYYQTDPSTNLDLKSKAAMAALDFMKSEPKVLTLPGTRVSQQALLPSLSVTGLRESGNNPILVHQGFLSVYNSFKQEIMKTLNGIERTKPIIISGHSLGAAVAILNGTDLTLTGLDVRSIVFAPPRVGNTAFADLLNSQANLLKWINTCDVIPTLPVSVSPNFTSPESPYFFTDGGGARYFTLNRKALINNHGIQTYIDAMNSLKSGAAMPLQTS